MPPPCPIYPRQSVQPSTWTCRLSGRSKYRAITQPSASRAWSQTGQILGTEGVAGQQWAQPNICMILSALPGNRLDFTLSPGPSRDEQRGQDRAPAGTGSGPASRRILEAGDRRPITMKTAASRHAERKAAISISIHSTIAGSGLRLLPVATHTEK